MDFWEGFSGGLILAQRVQMAISGPMEMGRVMRPERRVNRGALGVR